MENKSDRNGSARNGIDRDEAATYLDIVDSHPKDPDRSKRRAYYWLCWLFFGIYAAAALYGSDKVALTAAGVVIVVAFIFTVFIKNGKRKKPRQDPSAPDPQPRAWWMPLVIVMVFNAVQTAIPSQPLSVSIAVGIIVFLGMGVAGDYFKWGW